MGTVIIALLMFLLLVTIHEFGHFIVAKLSGIKVNEFAIGMGPKLFSKQKGETLYSFRALPIGGFCAMEGEMDESDNPRAYVNAKPYKKFLTILAGPVMNILTAFLIMLILAFNTGVASNNVRNLTKGLPAENSNIEIGDKVKSINSIPTDNLYEIAKIIDNYYLYNSKNEPISITVERNGEYIDTKILPDFKSERALIGIEVDFQKPTIKSAFQEGLRNTINSFKQIFFSFKLLFNGSAGVNDLGGPVAVVSMVNENQSKMNYDSLFRFLAFISLNLGIFNLLPFPILDGGRLIETIYEMIAGRRINKRITDFATLVGGTALIVLGIFITFKDIINLF